MATTLEELKVREAECEAQDKAFAKRLHAFGDAIAVGGDIAAEREKLTKSIRSNWGELAEVRRKMGELRESQKRERLEQTLGSAEYRQAVLDGLAQLVSELAPWAENFRFVNSDRRLPAMPAGKALAILQAKAWLEVHLRLGVLKSSDIPKGLQGFMGEK